jgi:LytS/YehU family sensor histidine kinase
MRVVTTLIGLGFCYLIHLLLRARRLNSTKKRLIALAIVAPFLAETYAWSAFFVMATVDPSLDLSKFTWTGAVNTIAFWTWFFLAWAGLYLALMYSFDVQDEQHRSAELRERAHVAQLRALHSQINPHFLFNSLNSVSALILDKQVDEADEMVGKLATFLRLGLSADPMQKIPLWAEVQLQRTYLEIEQLRYPDLQLSVLVDDDVADSPVPAFILQPIVENAVKHGLANAPPPGQITLAARRSGRKLHLEVINNSGDRQSIRRGAGIGLSNVGQRLELIYGDGRASLVAGRLPNSNYRVEIILPLEDA